jgi:hypothetical protein
MAQRGITRNDVEHALEHQISSWPTQQDSIQYIGLTSDGRELKVWVAQPGLSTDRPILKSAAWKGKDDEPNPT